MNLFDFLFPKRCVGCNKLGQYFCSQCIKDIKQTDLVCPFCEKPSIGGVIHPICKRHFGLDGLWSLGVYQDPLKKAIQKLKYKWIRKLAEVLVDLTIEYWAKYQPIVLERIKKDRGENWVIVPVPLHWTRENWRGFNQAKLLGQILSKKIGLDYCEYLKRTRSTRPQVGLDSSKRRENIKGAFKLTDNWKLKAVNCILVDDVWTTGATLKECCLILKRGGAEKVWALALAR